LIPLNATAADSEFDGNGCDGSDSGGGCDDDDNNDNYLFIKQILK
jgi:hypothetical protein